MDVKQLEPLLDISYPECTCELLIGIAKLDGGFHQSISIDAFQMPNAWWRFWYWALLGWRWRRK